MFLRFHLCVPLFWCLKLKLYQICNKRLEFHKLGEVLDFGFVLENGNSLSEEGWPVMVTDPEARLIARKKWKSASRIEENVPYVCNRWGRLFACVLCTGPSWAKMQCKVTIRKRWPFVSLVVCKTNE
jgi:hypothetical protein